MPEPGSKGHAEFWRRPSGGTALARSPSRSTIEVNTVAALANSTLFIVGLEDLMVLGSMPWLGMCSSMLPGEILKNDSVCA